MEKLIHIKSNDLKPEGGRVLIAEPLMDEIWFARAVILLIDHSDEGTLGIVMNKPSGISLSQAMEQDSGLDFMVYIGGPVSSNNIYFIHTLGDVIPESVKIRDGLYWGGEVDVIREMMAMNLIKEDQIRFFLGHSGWGPGQLSSEISRNSWIVSETSTRLLMKTRSHKMWNLFLQRMGPEYDLWRQFPINPEYN